MPSSGEGSSHLNDRPRLAKRVRLQIDPISKKPVLQNQESVILLNRTGHQILVRCDGTRTLSEIIQDLARHYPVAKSELAREVSQYVENLSGKGLLVWS